MRARILKRFEEEMADLDRELRQELPKEIQRARELGDLSENAEYQAAKERQSYIQARMGMLRKRMAEISLMNFDRLPADRAAFGSTVQLREEGTNAIVTYQLVMPEDADPTKGLISTASPIGRAIVGRQEGAEVTVPTPTGTRVFELLKLTTIHDEA
jgi:transcription elongation factor GreA